MPTPFPGMDPYLEHPSLWPNVHSSLIIALRDDLAPRLRPHYYVAVEERTVRLSPDDLSFYMRPDVAVVPTDVPMKTRSSMPSPEPGIVMVEVPQLEELRETYLAIYATDSQAVVTVLELLSPSNKLPGEGRRQYMQKRLNILASLTHLVELDLLRSGEAMPITGYLGRSDYRLLVSRAHQRPQAELRPFGVRQAIPSFTLPLRRATPEPKVELTPLLHALYDRAGYDLRIDYHQPPVPALAADDAQWATELLRAAGV
ncbi:hypothetical protein CJ255_20605 [Candidatus Viridilinea mediisalina]|uniref:DUF4058 domain-containing protein n=2 Tax=Candidatus Viridilinea mediisalina TaxID=2024553 RepID=A0A2A6RE51_9CHLR|nr:hypothetical protein CJ255_20605 [Candidatus Viridilinea mediisalina]